MRVELVERRDPVGALGKSARRLSPTFRPAMLVSVMETQAGVGGRAVAVGQLIERLQRIEQRWT